MTVFEIIGWIAAIGVVIMYIPQIIKVLKLKSTQGIEVKSFLIIAVGGLMWVIFTALFNSMQGFISNMLISLMMIVIIWYEFKKDMWKFISITSAIFTVILTSIIIYAFNLSNDIPFGFKVVILLIAGSCTGLGLLPQVIKVIKTKDFGNYSLISSLLITIFNILWVIYWIGKTTDSSGWEDISLGLLSALLSFFGLAIQLPVLALYVKTNHAKV